MNRFPFLLTTLMSLVFSFPSFSQQVIEMDEQNYISKKFDTLTLFDRHLKIFKNDKILICRQSDMNQNGGRLFKAVYRQFDYTNPSASRKLSLGSDIGLPVTIDYFFLLKSSESVYAKIKYAQENGQTLRWIVNINEALSLDEIQIPNSALINQYDLFKELLHKKEKIDGEDIQHYISLFDPVSTEGKNEFQLKKITDAALAKCDSLKSLSIVGREYFEFNRSQFDKYDFEKKGLEISVQKQFEYRLEPQLNSASERMGMDIAPDIAIVYFANLKRKKTEKELDDLRSAFKMGLLTMEEFNSRISDANSTLFISLDPTEGEKVITKIDSLSTGRQFYVLYKYKIIGTTLTKYGAGTGNQLQVECKLNSINLYYDPSRTMLFRVLEF